MQESAPLRDGHITRVETFGGKYLYAINVYPAVGSFDLCPADACQTTSGVELVGGACAVDAPKTGLAWRARTPPAEIIAQVERIAQAAQLDIGGIEYLVDDRDGKHYFYDVNALSNFVADPVNVVGFDPWAKFVDYLVRSADGRRATGDGNGARSRESELPRSPLPLPASRIPTRRGTLTMRYGYWLPGVRRLAPQRARRADGSVVGLRAAASRGAAKRSGSTSRSSPSCF